MEKRELWSDKNDAEYYSNKLSDDVSNIIYNLLEDIQCLKEEVSFLKNNDYVDKNCFNCVRDIRRCTLSKICIKNEYCSFILKPSLKKHK